MTQSGSPPRSPLLPIDEALARVLAAIAPLADECVALADAHQRILAEEILADTDVPAFDRAAMDGIAVRSQDATVGAQFLQVGESAAGAPFAGEVLAGQCVRVMTGGVVPRGADAVIPVERIERLGATAYRSAIAAVAEQHVARRGSEVKKGEVVLRVGQRLTGACIGVLATYGHAQVRVYRQPRVAIVPTGNEIVPVEVAPALGQVRDANRHALAGLLRQTGAKIAQFPVALDTHEALTEALAQAWEHADVLVTSGGVSAGDYDLVAPVLTALGATIHFHQIAIKPGKPLLFAVREHAGRRQFAFGLPGNPVSSYVCCALFVLPALAALQDAPAAWQQLTLPVLRGLPATGPRSEILPARLSQRDGMTQADVWALSSSADLTRFSAAEWFALRPPHAPPLEPGALVTLLAAPRP